MEFFVHMYRWEWDQSEGQNLSARVDAWLDLFYQSGFTAIAVTERADYMWDGTGWTGTPYIKRPLLSGPNDTILKRIKAHHGTGFKLLLRQQTCIPDAISTSIASTYGGGVIGPRIGVETMRGLNPYDPRSADLLADHAAALRDALYADTDWLEIGWTTSGEADDIRGFIGGLNTPAKKFRTDPAFITRPGIDRAAPPSPLVRSLRIDDAHQAMGRLWDAARAVYGSSKPIGLLRGSCWHAQTVRRNLPFFPGETLAQVDDVNQAQNGWCSGVGFDIPLQTNALAFSCDILKGSGIPFLINEVDGMAVNFANMEPPRLPHQSSNYDNVDNQNEVRTRALLGFGRGVSFMVTHFRYSDNPNIPDYERKTPFLVNWVANMQEIATHRNDQPVPGGAPIQEDADNIPGAITAWKQADGGEAYSIPIVFPAV